MTHSVILVSTPDKAGGTLKTEPLATFNDDESVEELKTQIGLMKLYQEDALRCKNARAVYIEDIDMEEYRKYLDQPRVVGQFAAQPVEQGQSFPSAMTASRYIGMKYNGVSLTLSAVEAAGGQSGTVRGVTFRYVDTLSV